MSRIKNFLGTVLVGGLLAMTSGSAAYVGFESHAPLLEEQSSTRHIAHKLNHRPTVQISGVITDEGVECTALRGADGRLYTLASNSGGFQPGDRVRVIGRVAQASFCMQGTTIEVRRIIVFR
jgi:hypothetical protein